MSEYYQLTEETLTGLTKCSKKARKEALGMIGTYEYHHCGDDPLYWLDHTQHVKTKTYPMGLPYVFTKDPHIVYKCRTCGVEIFGDKRGTHLELSHKILTTSIRGLGEQFEEMPPTRPFTVIEYMPPIIQAYLGSQFFAMEKSRDMMATWLMVALSAWDVLFHKGRQHIFQSQDAGKTLELTQRAKIIYDNTPFFLRQAIGPVVFGKGNSKSGELFVLRQESEILGFPQGADQIRQFHPSLVFSDESAFQILAGEAFAAIKPAIQQGGKYVAISSANRSHFELICRDRTDE
jgi:hypothetical protein